MNEAVSPAVTIEFKPNGPCLVRNLDDLRNSRGEPLAAQPAMALCRCGGSANKPFCDGTHRSNGFSSEKTPGRLPDKLDSYPAPRITIHDNRSICAHSGICTDTLAAVFRYGSEPWIDPDAAAVDAIVDAIRRCPSGALSYTVDGESGPGTQQAASITATKDGPYAVVGCAPPPGDEPGQGASTTRYTLCRCGASKNKPFCDGSHWDSGFKDEAN